MSDALELNKDNWEAEVDKSEVPVLVDFFSESCGPCKMMGPIIDEVAGELAGKVKVAKVDCDASADVAGRFDITSIPSLILFKNGSEADRKTGACAKEDLVSWLTENADP